MTVVHDDRREVLHLDLPDGFHAELLTEPIAWEDGYLIAPDRPGIGHELNEAVARAHPYDGDELHFDMHPEPL